MILSRQIFKHQNRTLIEKVTIKPPYRHQVIFQSEGCFVYVAGASATFHSSDQKEVTKSEEAVLLKCGPYFVDLLKKSETDKVEVIAIHLYPDLLNKLYQRDFPELINQQVKGSKIQRIIPENTISKFIENLEFYFQNPALVNDDLLELKIKELILLLIQTKNAESILQLLSDLFTPRVVNIKETVNVHLFSSLSVEELAKLCNLSLSSFKREFKKIFNDTPSNFINTERLKKAVELLKVSDFTISDIAYAAGFNDPSYFARLFKNKMGMSPSTFRGKHGLN
ncbi:MAG: helix-turn-helix transcriptional regulator [Flavobacteriales bacterium]|nr:helix-turn-helix transcriptional regulator [Flavobacteriales bacterium]